MDRNITSGPFYHYQKICNNLTKTVYMSGVSCTQAVHEMKIKVKLMCFTTETVSEALNLMSNDFTDKSHLKSQLGEL